MRTLTEPERIPVTIVEFDEEHALPPCMRRHRSTEVMVHADVDPTAIRVGARDGSARAATVAERRPTGFSRKRQTFERYLDRNRRRILLRCQEQLIPARCVDSPSCSG
jgi:hypothetical protein